MRILDRSVYVGPSLYAHFPVIRLELDLGPLEAWPTGRLGAAFVDGLIAALPGLHEHGCSYGERTKAPGSATCSSTSRSSCRTSRAST
jgi:cyanophycin synthetase